MLNFNIHPEPKNCTNCFVAFCPKTPLGFVMKFLQSLFYFIYIDYKMTVENSRTEGPDTNQDHDRTAFLLTLLIRISPRSALTDAEKGATGERGAFVFSEVRRKVSAITVPCIHNEYC